MTNHLQVALEIGPKGKKVVAVASAWPGLARGAANEQAALERLRAYIPRYASVAALAGLESAFAATNEPEIVERYPGTGSTDFWGISFAFSEHDQQPVSNEELERELALLRACWAFFDTVRAQVSPEMRRGPRGGGRDRANTYVARRTNSMSRCFARARSPIWHAALTACSTARSSCENLSPA